MTYFYDNKRHLVCVPYSVENLHMMAKELGIPRNYFHRRGKKLHPHYDVPVHMKQEIAKRCTLVDRRVILLIIKSVYP